MQRRPPLTPSGTLQSLNNLPDEDAAVASTTVVQTGGGVTVGVQATPKSKRATSFIRKKPPLERGLSAQSALRINKNALVGMCLCAHLDVVVWFARVYFNRLRACVCFVSY